MNNTKKVAIGLGLVSGALLTAWLLTGSRKAKTTTYVVRNAKKLRGAMKRPVKKFEDSTTLYV